MSAKWSKREVKAVRSALDGFALTMQSFYPASALRAELAARRRARAVEGIARLVEIRDRYCDEALATAAHAKSSRVWGDSTEEMFDRFTTLAAEHEKVAAWYRALAARLEAGEFPPELDDYLPPSIASAA